MIVREKERIDPYDLLWVTFKLKGKELRRACFSVAFVAAENNDGNPIVAVELRYDAKNQKPDRIYTCTEHRKVLVSAKDLVRLETYRK